MQWSFSYENILRLRDFMLFVYQSVFMNESRQSADFYNFTINRLFMRLFSRHKRGDRMSNKFSFQLHCVVGETSRTFVSNYGLI